MLGIPTVPTFDSKLMASERVCVGGIYTASGARGYFCGSTMCIWLSHVFWGIFIADCMLVLVLAVVVVVMGLRVCLGLKKDRRSFNRLIEDMSEPWLG